MPDAVEVVHASLVPDEPGPGVLSHLTLLQQSNLAGICTTTYVWVLCLQTWADRLATRFLESWRIRCVVLRHDIIQTCTGAVAVNAVQAWCHAWRVARPSPPAYTSSVSP
jgi:hypothetical protein